MTKHVLFMSLVAAAVIAGCDDKQTATPKATQAAAQSNATAANAAAALPATLRLAAAPPDAREIAAVKSAVKDGDRVVVRGTVAGREEPIAENRAILTLLDSSVKTCDKNAGDQCKTPWDACCEPADVIAKNSVTVQVVDADGRPVKTSLSSIEGVKPLAQLVVSGTAKVSADGAVLVNADGVHVAR